MLLDPDCIERRENTTEGDLDLSVGSPDLAGEDFRVGIARARKKAEPYQIRLQALDLVDDDVVRRLWVRLIEHHAFVALALEHCGERHDPDRREADDLDVTSLRAFLSGEGVELGIANVNQNDAHRSASS